MGIWTRLSLNKEFGVLAVREGLSYSNNYELTLQHKNTESCCHVSRSTHFPGFTM